MKLSRDAIKHKLATAARKVRHYTVPLFLLFLLGIYGFLAYQVVTLNQQQPDQADVTTGLRSAGVPHIDPDVLTKIQQLQDNSVGAQTLFDQARSNPFQE